MMLTLQKAMCKLIRGGEIELAVSIGLVLRSVDSQLRVAVELLSRRCENLGKWSVRDAYISFFSRLQ